MFAFKVVLLLLAAITTSVSGDPSEDLPNVIIGDPNGAASDVVGPDISEAEFEAALANEDLLTYQPEDNSLFNNPYTFFQGDIQIKSKDQLIEIILNKETKGQSSAISNPSLKWPSAQIPYFISSQFSSHERAVIARAMAEYHQVTCIRFIPRTTHRNYIHILRGSGCSSMVGRVGGAQTVSLGHGCVQFGTVIHELMHAAGFWHEQSRYDRDSYVTINWSNIWPGMAYNFNKKTRSVTQDLGLPYDYQSVMHYPQYAFARNRAIPTIYPRQSGARISGQHLGFSELDKKGLNLLYQCSGVRPPKPSGCVDSNQFCSDWANKGQCHSNPKYMHVYCKKSCKKCGTKPTNCVDKNQHCSDWAKKGQCNSNPAYMKPNCPKSCNLCDDPITTNCVDKNQHCSDWAKKGQCNSNAAYMKPNCPKSCNACDESIITKCVDTNAFCPDWASKGQCNSNPAYMHKSCKKSCNKCHVPEPKTTVKPTVKPTKGTTTLPTTITTTLPTTITTTTSTTSTTNLTTAMLTEAPEPTLCKDDSEFCSYWVSIGQCESNSDFMHVICKKSCDRCNIPKPTGNCLDDNEFCPGWAKKGHCESNAEFMKESCKRSCKICSTITISTVQPASSTTEESTEAPTEIATVTDSPTYETMPITSENPTETSINETMPIITVDPTDTSINETTETTDIPEICEDDSKFCSDWASNGQCDSNPGFMYVKCKKSCDRCNIPKPTGNCLDDNEFCPDWATKGYCESNAEYMKETCKRSCKICEL